MKWIKSSKCDGGTCVEVFMDTSTMNGTIGVRNNKIPGEVVWFTIAEWTTFLSAVRDGEFNPQA